MYKRILLVYPPSVSMNREDRCQIPVKNVVMEPLYPPMDLLSLAAVGEGEGGVCRVSDHSRGNGTPELFLREIIEFAPDLLLMSVTTPTLAADLGLCSAIKKVAPGVKVIAKGAHFLKFDREVLKAYPDLDMVIRGETERTFRDIVSGADMKDIAGISWRSQQGIVSNPDRPFIEDLDGLPFPARHLVDKNRYLMPHNGRPMGVIRVSRGCPYHCFFCLATPVAGKRVRKRSPESIVDEIKLCMDRYGMSDFVFYSDVFNVDRDWVVKLCRNITDSGLRVSWSSNVRVDSVDRETIMLMKKAGCFLVSFGVESGSQEVRDRMGKAIRTDQIRDAMKIFKEAGLRTYPYYLIGLPWDTHETVENTVRFAIDLGSDYAGIFTATPFPGTRFYDYAVENGLLENSGAESGACFEGAYRYPVAGGHYLSRDEIALLHKKAINRYFMRPGYIAKHIGRIRSLREFLNYSKVALSLLGRGGAKRL
ncbi:MAG: radical SAM protein [Nitrospirae bacterium]|nr:MAG: radical SAM protein [Nitrospirota bacterium]